MLNGLSIFSSLPLLSNTKPEKKNRANVLSRVHTLLHILNITMIRFDKLKEAFVDYHDFIETYILLSHRSIGNSDYTLHNGYMFYGNRLYIIKT